MSQSQQSSELSLSKVYIIRRSEAQDRLTMQNLDLRIPKCRLTMGRRLFVFRGAKIQWKGLPKDLKST